MFVIQIIDSEQIDNNNKIFVLHILPQSLVSYNAWHRAICFEHNFDNLIILFCKNCDI